MLILVWLDMFGVMFLWKYKTPRVLESTATFCVGLPYTDKQFWPLKERTQWGGIFRFPFISHFGTLLNLMVPWFAGWEPLWSKSRGCSIRLGPGETVGQINTLDSCCVRWAGYDLNPSEGVLCLQKCLGGWYVSKKHPHECQKPRFPCRIWYCNKVINVTLFPLSVVLLFLLTGGRQLCL